MKFFNQFLHNYPNSNNNKFPNTHTIRVVWNFLIAICEATHSAHHAEHIVVGSIHAHGGGGGGADGVVGHSQDEGGVIDTG